MFAVEHHLSMKSVNRHPHEKFEIPPFETLSIRSLSSILSNLTTADGVPANERNFDVRLPKERNSDVRHLSKWSQARKRNQASSLQSSCQKLSIGRLIEAK